MSTSRQPWLRFAQQIDTYVLPRLGRAGEHPLVVTLGGPTGAGKSTLTNSLVGANVSSTGVIRPTTREPVVLYNATDAEAVFRLGLLPDGPPHKDDPSSPAGPVIRGGIAPGLKVAVRTIAHPDVPPGLVVADSPDLDSLEATNRTTARQLMEIGDVWLFVTTGTDYADVLSWELLEAAADRSMTVAVVLNRMRRDDVPQVRLHLAHMLRDHGLGATALFTLTESMLTNGRIATQTVLPLLKWLERQADNPTLRAAHTLHALDGTVRTLVSDVVATTTNSEVSGSRGITSETAAGLRSAADTVQRQWDRYHYLVQREAKRAAKAAAEESPANDDGS